MNKSSNFKSGSRLFARGGACLGFTLIEVLVVISIIALLMSMLMPALRTATNHARKINCAGNVKQLMIAEFSYDSDHNAFAQNGVSCGMGNIAWWWLLVNAGYLPPPTDPQTLSDGAFGTWGISRCYAFKGDVFSYGGGYSMTQSYTALVDAQSAGQTQFISFRQVRKSPSRKVFMSDGNPWYRIGRYAQWKWYADGTNGGLNYSRHIDGANAGYMDGHVNFVRLAEKPDGIYNNEDWICDK